MNNASDNGLSMTQAMQNEHFAAMYSPEAFYSKVHELISKAIMKLEKFRDILCDCSEDQVSLAIALFLDGHATAQGWRIEHDFHQAGHCDLAITSDFYTWIGEAKVYSGSAYSLEGYRQLVDRYATGGSHCKVGGQLIYLTNKSTGIVKKNSLILTQEWRQFLETNVKGNVEFEGFRMGDAMEPRPEISFSTFQSLKDIGTEYQVNHYIISIVHKPTDKSAQQSKVTAQKSVAKKAKPTTSKAKPSTRKAKPVIKS